MQEKLKDSILEDLCTSRMEGYESSFIKKYEKIQEREMTLKSENELINSIKTYIKEEQKQVQVIEEINTLVLNLSGEMSFWNTQYYKRGFVDGMNFNKEVTSESGVLL